MENEDVNWSTEGENQIAKFMQSEIRRVFHNSEWWFSIVDVIAALTESKDPKQYIREMRKREPALDSKWGEITTPLEMLAPDGKKRSTSAINVEGILRIVQSIPSKYVEPFKDWLAKVGYERIQEYNNPALAIERAINTYRKKGYNDEWIKARIGTLQSRKELTDEWSKRKLNKVHYALLTDAISIKTFGINTSEHRELKKIGDSFRLRDNMTPVELALTMLGETSTMLIARKDNAIGYTKNLKAAEEGGTIAGTARESLEKKLGKSVVSSHNYLTDKQKQKTLEEGKKESDQLSF